METKEDISHEKIYNSIENIQSAIEDLKQSGLRQYMRNRYRQAATIGLSTSMFAAGLLTASIGENPQIAFAAGLLVGGIAIMIVSTIFLTRAQRANYIPPQKT